VIFASAFADAIDAYSSKARNGEPKLPPLNPYFYYLAAAPATILPPETPLGFLILNKARRKKEESHSLLP